MGWHMEAGAGEKLVRVSHNPRLISTHPQIAAQWHPSLNGQRTPAEVTPTSTYHAWWICEKGLGNDAEIEDLSQDHLKLLALQLVLEQFPEDDLIESMLGGYAITEKLAHSLSASGFSGFELRHMDVLEGAQLFLWKDKHPEGLPNLTWLNVTGQPGQNDFGLREKAQASPLVVSERALARQL